MKYYITINTVGHPMTMIEIDGMEVAWDKYSALAEILEGLAIVQLVDGETAEIVANNEE